MSNLYHWSLYCFFASELSKRQNKAAFHAFLFHLTESPRIDPSLTQLIPNKLYIKFHRIWDVLQWRSKCSKDFLLATQIASTCLLKSFSFKILHHHYSAMPSFPLIKADPWWYEPVPNGWCFLICTWIFPLITWSDWKYTFLFLSPYWYIIFLSIQLMLT